MFAAMRDWNRWRPVILELLTSILLGVIIEICLLSFEPPTLLIVRQAADETADRMIRLAERTTGRIDTATAFSFIDIDDATWTAWGSPLVTPRARIADLIERAARSSPLAIILDVDLAFQGDIKDEARLRDTLKAYDPQGPPLILVRSLIGAPPSGSRLPSARTTPYEQDVGQSKNIIWASPLFEQDADGVVRRWRLFNAICDADGRPAVVPATHIVAASLARDAAYGVPPAADPMPLARLDKALAQFVPESCDHPVSVKDGTISDWPPDRPIEIANDDVSSRLIYRVAWTPGAIGIGPLVDTREGRTQLVEIRPASTVLAADGTAPLPGFKSRIVVIGGSYADSGDWHDTPIGRMPGALMIVNAVEALTLNGTPREPALGARILISFSIIVVASLLTSLLRPYVAAWALALGIFLLMVLSIGQFKSGVMLDLAVPAVGALLHDIGESIVHAVRDWRRLGWRWLLKPHPAEEHHPVSAAPAASIATAASPAATSPAAASPAAASPAVTSPEGAKAS